MAGRDHQGDCACICSKCEAARKYGSVLFGDKHCARRKRGCNVRPK